MLGHVHYIVEIIYSLPGIDDDDCENTLIGDEVLSLAVSQTRIFTGVSGTNVLSAYNWEGEGEGVVGPR